MVLKFRTRKKKWKLNNFRIRVVESIPQNISFPNSTLPMSTFSAWKQLIEMSTRELDIAAYKSSLQGKHVLGDMGQMYSAEVGLI